MKLLTPKAAKIIFEQELGKEIAIATWYRMLKIFDSDLPLTIQNVKFLATIRSQVPKAKLKSIRAVTLLKKDRNWLKLKDSKATGNEVLERLAAHGIQVHPNTLSRWFRPCGGFSKNKEYTMIELLPVLIAAHTYALKKEVKSI